MSNAGPIPGLAACVEVMEANAAGKGGTPFAERDGCRNDGGRHGNTDD